MKFISRPAALAVAFVAALALAYGCQIRDAGVPTEADRTLEAAGPDEDAIIALIDELFDPALGKSVKKSFNSIVADLKKNKTAVAQAKTRTLIDFILKHYADGKLLSTATSAKVGNLNLELLQYAGLLPNVEDAAGAACLPGDPECEAFPAEGRAHVPGDLITQPFTVLVYEVDCSTLGEDIKWVPPCYEVETYPPQTFTPSTSSSLSLSQFGDLPVVGVCTDLDDDLLPGEDVFLYHSHDGEIEKTDFIPGFQACSSSETTSRWADPLFATFRPVLEILGPQPLYAAGVGSVSGAISNFSTLFACLPGCLPTTTTLTLLNGSTPTTVFTAGQNITFHVVVDPAPASDENSTPTGAPGPKAVVYLTEGEGHAADPIEVLVDGEMTVTIPCGGDARIPATGTHTAVAQFFGTVGHSFSISEFIEYQCNPAGS